MKKIISLFLLAFIALLSSCFTVNQIDISPDLDAASEIPADIALNWLLREPVVLSSDLGLEGQSTCEFSTEGVRASLSEDQQILAFSSWKVDYWYLRQFIKDSWSDLRGTIVLRKMGTIAATSKNICIAYFFQHSFGIGDDIQAMIGARQKEQGKTLTALKVVGVQFSDQ